MITKFHYYALSFSYATEKDNGMAMICIGAGNKEPITWPMIQDAKEKAAPSIPKNNMVLVAATYLGYMTTKQFETGEP
jgi:hypothetical protein